MNKKELTEICKLSPSTVSKMGSGEFVSMDVLYRRRTKLDADFEEMFSIIRKSNDE